MSATWTTVDDLIVTLRKRWKRGEYFIAHLAGTPWEPICLPVRGPKAADILHRFDEATEWAERFRRDSHTRNGQSRFRTEQRVRISRGVGVNEVPSRIHIDSFEQLCKLLGTEAEVRQAKAMIDAAADLDDRIVAWVQEHPHRALEHGAVWSEILATVRWIAEHDTTNLYVRHIDLAGVDTKFVEHNAKVLGQLLTIVLPDERVHPTGRNFATRFGFRTKPGFTRLRLLTPLPTFPPISDVQLRTDELAALDLPVSTVFIIENETSYLAFPAVADAIAIWGEGFGVTTLDALPWLADKEIVYWGDIDTHGFAILNRLRQRFPTVRSTLMDRDTLLAHSDQYAREDNPTTAPQPHLTQAEASLYDDLIEDRYGPNTRLEQERIRFSLLHQALTPWTGEESAPAHP